MYELLDKINSPADIKGFDMNQLEQLCSELRQYMVECCSKTPGHLGSSLGAVELIVAMHYVYDAPKDKFIFDVGHQAYAHKILTGRREAFKTLRTEGGISGFPRRSESEYDAFGVGHSSTSVSAALGLAEAARMQGLEEKVVALIGDGALTGGLALEGLNNAGASKADLLVILNDNNISIDPNRGGLHKHLLRLTTSGKYNKFKNKVWNSLGERGFRHFVQRWVRSLKAWMVKRTGGDLFEALGFRYFGPVDGNDIRMVVASLQRLKKLKGPRVVHFITTKGKGYPAAEANPTIWHAPGKFDPDTGERIPTHYDAARYQDVFGKVLCDLAAQDDKIVGITPAMASGSGMHEFAKKFPKRFFDVGIEEEHAVTFSAGLAAGGMKPICNIYSSFSQRAYDEIIHDVALQNLPVVFCFDRAGLVGEDGATHNGAFDLAAYRSIPNMTIAAPSNELELKNLMYTATQPGNGPFIIRYPRGCGEGVDWKDVPFSPIPVGSSEQICEGSELAIVGIGPMVNAALKAAEQFPGKVAVYNFRYLKPLDTATLDKIANTYKYIITVEDGCLKGGLFGAVSEYLASKDTLVEGIGIADEFVEHARQSSQREHYGLDEKSIAKKIQNFLENHK